MRSLRPDIFILLSQNNHRGQTRALPPANKQFKAAGILKVGTVNTMFYIYAKETESPLQSLTLLHSIKKLRIATEDHVLQKH